MRFFRPLVLSCLALALTAAGPDTFTRQDLEALEKEKRAAEQKLEQLQSTGETAARDLQSLDQDLLAAAAEALRREEQAVSAEKALIDLSVERGRAAAQLLENEETYEDLIAALAAANRRRPPALVVSPGQSGTAIRRATTSPSTSGTSPASNPRMFQIPVSNDRQLTSLHQPIQTVSHVYQSASGTHNPASVSERIAYSVCNES